MYPYHYRGPVPSRTTENHPLPLPNPSLPTSQPQILGGWSQPPTPPPQSQFENIPLVPGGHVRPVPSSLYRRSYTPEPNRYPQSPGLAPTWGPYPPTVWPEPVNEDIPGLKSESGLEPEGILKTGMTPTPRPYDPPAATGIYYSPKQDKGHEDSGVDAEYDTGGSYRDDSWWESPGPETDVNHETTSSSCDTLESCYKEYHHHHHYHYHHNDDDESRSTPAAPWHPDQSRNCDHNVDDRDAGGADEVGAEELGNPTREEEDGDGGCLGGDEARISTASPCSPNSSSSPSSDSQAATTPELRGSGSDAEEEAMDTSREHQFRMDRLRDLMALARSATAADVQGRPIIVVAGDCYYNRAVTASASPSPEVAPIVLVAGNMYDYPGGLSSSSSSRQKKRRRDDDDDDVQEGDTERTDRPSFKRPRFSRGG
ncbi:hypothetical protein F5X99DRAFT_406647 [Biscogniauxia marginata]|nr:hypothetical protein F5X99DRAFT_406647 [Biscogniauxia marginata]